MTTTLPTAQATATPATVVTAFISSLDAKQATRNTYTRALQAFICWVAETGRALDSLDTADIVAYKQHLLSVHSTATTQIYLDSIRGELRLTDAAEDAAASYLCI